MKAKDLNASNRKRLSLSIYLVGGVALLAGLITVILAAASDSEQTSVELPDYSGISSSWQNRNILGDPDAPVTVQAWEDFRCPACAAFNQRVKPGLIDNYISTGKVKLEYRHFPLQQHEPGASLAAQASECAADQGRFWVYHDRVFQATSSGANAFLMERLIDYAVELDLDRDTFASCLTNQEHLLTVSESLQDARSAGHNSTPTVLVDGVRVDSPLDYGTVSAAIDIQLASDQ